MQKRMSDPQEAEPPPREPAVRLGSTLSGQHSAEAPAAGESRAEELLRRASLPAIPNNFQAEVLKPKLLSGPRSKTSPYFGVTLYKRTGRWESHIWDSTGVKGRQHHLGSFPNAQTAARAYDRAAIRLKGWAARTNFGNEAYRQDAFLQENLQLDVETFILKLRMSARGQGEGVRRRSSSPAGLGPLHHAQEACRNAAAADASHQHKVPAGGEGKAIARSGPLTFNITASSITAAPQTYPQPPPQTQLPPSQPVTPPRPKPAAAPPHLSRTPRALASAQPDWRDNAPSAFTAVQNSASVAPANQDARAARLVKCSSAPESLGGRVSASLDRAEDTGGCANGEGSAGVAALQAAYAVAVQQLASQQQVPPSSMAAPQQVQLPMPCISSWPAHASSLPLPAPPASSHSQLPWSWVPQPLPYTHIPHCLSSGPATACLPMIVPHGMASLPLPGGLEAYPGIPIAPSPHGLHPQQHPGTAPPEGLHLQGPSTRAATSPANHTSPAPAPLLAGHALSAHPTFASADAQRHSASVWELLNSGRLLATCSPNDALAQWRIMADALAEAWGWRVEQPVPGLHASLMKQQQPRTGSATALDGSPLDTKGDSDAEFTSGAQRDQPASPPAPLPIHEASAEALLTSAARPASDSPAYGRQPPHKGSPSAAASAEKRQLEPAGKQGNLEVGSGDASREDGPLAKKPRLARREPGLTAWPSSGELHMLEVEDLLRLQVALCSLSCSVSHLITSKLAARSGGDE